MIKVRRDDEVRITVWTPVSMDEQSLTGRHADVHMKLFAHRLLSARTKRSLTNLRMLKL